MDSRGTEVFSFKIRAISKYYFNSCLSNIEVFFKAAEGPGRSKQIQFLTY